MAENFDLIFGQNASQQYAWNDTDYQNGWETIGNIPPTAAQFDALQRRNDTKMKVLNDELTPLVNADTADSRQPSTTYNVDDIKYSPLLPTGWYLLCTTGGISSASDLVITSPSVGDTITDNTVVWTIGKIGAADLSSCANTDLSNLSAAGLALIQQHSGGIIAGNLAQNGYVKFENGLIMQWGYNNTNMGNNKQVTITYPIPFTEFVNPQAIIVRSGNTSYGTMSLYHLPTLTSAVFMQDGEYGELGFFWFAIGK